MWNGSCNILDDSSAEICSPSKSEDVEVFNMIAGISESGTLIKHIPYNCNVIQSKNGAKINVNMNSYKVVNKMKDYAWNPSLCACECDKDCEIDEYLKNYAC